MRLKPVHAAEQRGEQRGERSIRNNALPMQISNWVAREQAGGGAGAVQFVLVWGMAAAG